MRFNISIDRLTQFHTERGQDELDRIGGLQAVAAALGVDVSRGILPSEVQERQDNFGVNRIPEKPPKSYLEYLKDSFEDFTIRLLCGCAVISILIAVIFQRDEELSWIEGVAILVTVLIVCNIQAVQDWSKERSFRKLNSEVNRLSIPVLRNGVVSEVLRYDIVVGDVLEIGVGDILEADGILIKGEDIEVDESALTGEPEDIKKNITDAPFLFSGTSVKNGTGRFLATSVGVNTQNGKITALVRGQKVKASGAGDRDEKSVAPEEIAKNLGGLSPENITVQVEDKEEEDDDDEEETSVLKNKLNLMVARITYFAFGAAAIATTVMLIRWVIEDHIVGKMDWRWDHDPNRILEAFLTGIIIVVVAVPEGLPLAVTLALSLSMGRMQADANLVKHMDATETMGSATAVCSDKTGTLTQNKMTVVRAYLGNREFAGGDSVERSCGKLLAAERVLCAEFQEALCENICATRAQGTEITWDKERNNWEQKGNKTDCALLAFAKDLGVDCEELRARPDFQTIDKGGQKVFGLKMYPFSSSRKRAGLAVPRTSDPNGPCRLYVKGASEIIIKMCTQAAQIDGRVEPLPEERKAVIFDNVIEKFASHAMRTIGLAYRDFDTVPDWDEEISDEKSEALTGLSAKTFEVETGLTFLGVMGIHDPLREGVPEAVAKCNKAGIDVRMVTGDHKATAVAIAKECGILRKGIDYRDCPGEPLSNEFVALTGEEFRRKVTSKGQIDQEAFDEVWPHLRVLARSSPEDKHTLVTGIMASRLYETDKGKEMGIFSDRQVVAVTGDGTNDAPALRKADVGFAMKIAGTRVAQDAADILLLDDNFASVVKACMWGRNVYDSIVKFLQFQLTVNFSAVIISIIGAIVVKQAPLGVVQMLWVNLIMDSLGALALAYESPTEALLDRKPYGRGQGLIAFEMVCTIGCHTVYQVIVLLVILFHGAGPRRPQGLSHEELEAFVYEPGGFLNIETGIGREGNVPTQHYTVIFNAFVFMQLFNWINCRKVHFEWNAFEGIQGNKQFCAIWLTCVGVQILVTQIGNAFSSSGTFTAFQTKALTGEQWVLCLVLGGFSMILQLAVVAMGQALKPYVVKVEGDGALTPVPSPHGPHGAHGTPGPTGAHGILPELVGRARNVKVTRNSWGTTSSDTVRSFWGGNRYSLDKSEPGV